MSVSLSVPFINVITNDRSNVIFTLKSFKSGDNIREYNKYCRQFKQFIVKILTYIGNRRIYDIPNATNDQKPEEMKQFIQGINHSVMIRLNKGILSSIIAFFAHHLTNIEVLDKHKIFNTLTVPKKKNKKKNILNSKCAPKQCVVII